jgi:hypothetical protein
MRTAENVPQMVRLTYMVPDTMAGRVFTMRRVPQGGTVEALEAVLEAPAPVMEEHPVVEHRTAPQEPARSEPRRAQTPNRATSADSSTGLVNVGLDLGRSETRVYDGDHLLTFPTMVGGPVATIRRGSQQLIDDHLEANLHLKVDGHEFSVGKYALEQPFLFPLPGRIEQGAVVVSPGSSHAPPRP